MRTYELARILGMDLMSRILARNLYTIISNTRDNEDVAIDFANVYFVTRSFADEFYNVFLKTPPFKISIINASDDISSMLSAVKRTQKAKKRTTTDNIKNTNNIEEFKSAFNLIGI